MTAFNDLLYLLFQLVMLFVIFNGLQRIWYEWVRPFIGYTESDIPWLEDEIKHFQTIKSAIEEVNSGDNK